MTSHSTPVGNRPIASILVVEDEAKLRESLAEGLRLESWEVATAGDGAEAVRLIRSTHFDLVVLDWMLPDMEGVEVVRVIRERDEKLPIVMITARSLRPDRDMAREGGITAFLPKPFAFADLVTRCRSLVPAAPGGDGVGSARGAAAGRRAPASGAKPS